jgi:hypothetical protein
MARAAIAGQLRYAMALLDCKHPDASKYELYSAVGSLAYKSGFASFDAFNIQKATSRYTLALHCAQAVNNWHFGPWCLRNGRQAFWLGDIQQALTNVEMALVRADLSRQLSAACCRLFAHDRWKTW